MPLALRVGSVLKLGGTSWRIGAIDYQGHGRSALTVIGFLHDSPSTVEDITFLDEHERKLKSGWSGSASFQKVAGRNDAGRVYDQGYEVFTRAQRVTARVTYFPQAQRLVVPLTGQVPLSP